MLKFFCVIFSASFFWHYKSPFYYRLLHNFFFVQFSITYPAQNLKKNVLIRYQINKIKRNKNSYTAGERKSINHNHQKTISNTIQAIRLVTQINVLKGIGKTEQESATKTANAKAGEKYGRLKRGGFIFDSPAEEKTKPKNINYKEENNREKEESKEEQNHEQERGKTRSRSR